MVKFSLKLRVSTGVQISQEKTHTGKSTWWSHENRLKKIYSIVLAYNREGPPK